MLKKYTKTLKTMKKAILRNTILVLFITACGCTKDNGTQEDVLPPITQTGANTFGFVYDGVVFTPTDSNSRGFGIDGGATSGLSVGGAYFDTEHYSNKIKAHRYTNIKNVRIIYVYIYKLSSIGIGTYTLGGYNLREGSGILQPYNSYISMYATSPSTSKLTSYYSYENSGEIIITRKDEGNIYIFSGTFSGKLQSADGAEAVEITERKI